MTHAEAGRNARGNSAREPLTRTERLFITMFITMFAATLGAGAVGFTALSGQILDLEQRIGDLSTEMHADIGSLRTEMHFEIGSLRTEMHAEIGDLSERMARVETLIQTHLVPPAARPPARP